MHVKNALCVLLRVCLVFVARGCFRAVPGRHLQRACWVTTVGTIGLETQTKQGKHAHYDQKSDSQVNLILEFVVGGGRSIEFCRYHRSFRRVNGGGEHRMVTKEGFRSL